MIGKALLVLAGVGGMVGLAAIPSQKLHFKQNGFSIAALEEPAQGQNHTALTMYLSTSDGFAPNVNVMIQPFAGTVDDYLAVSKQQFDQAKFKLVKENKVDKNNATMEYTGQMMSRPLHWYAKAVLKTGQVYLVTGTAHENQWAGVNEKLKACVDSFELDKEEAVPEAGNK